MPEPIRSDNLSSPSGPSASDEEDSPADYIVDINCNVPAWQKWASPLEAWTLASMQALRMPPGEISLYLTDDADCAVYNERFRGRTGPTNVLSFPVPRPDGDALHGPRLWGDILLSYETITREAAEQGKDFEAHLVHLLVHGLLHLQGFDHENDAEAAIMESHEISTLAQLGFANPYRLDEEHA